MIQGAHKQKLTLVTFDLRTIQPLQRQWGEQSIDHRGVILVDEPTLAPNDIGGLVVALCAVWKTQGARDHPRIWAGLEATGKMIGPYDLIVAATALERDCEVATFNQRRFGCVPGLKVIEPK